MGSEVGFFPTEEILDVEVAVHRQPEDAVKRVEANFAVFYICRELGVSTATFYEWRATY